MATYEVRYKAKDGTSGSFKLKTDKKFGLRTDAHHGGLYIPFRQSMEFKARDIMMREDSNMYQHGGIDKYISVRCIETGRIVFANEHGMI